MLLATPAQAAPYSLPRAATNVKGDHGGGNSASSSGGSTNSSLGGGGRGNALYHGPAVMAGAASAGAARSSAQSAAKKYADSASLASSALMKTLSVRLNRGTEFLRDTVQKALVSSSSSGSSLARAAISRVPLLSPAASSNSNAVRGPAIAGRATAAEVGTTKTAGGVGAGGFSLSHVFTKLSGPVESPAVLKPFYVPPTAIHRNTGERLRSGSADSLHKEMCHFKPIRAAPTTPWKCSSKSRGGATLKTPKASLATQVNLKPNCDDHNAAASVAAVKKEAGAEDCGHADSERHRPPIRSVGTVSSLRLQLGHRSAFACLVARFGQAQQKSSHGPITAGGKAARRARTATTVKIHRTRKCGAGHKRRSRRKSPLAGGGNDDASLDASKAHRDGEKSSTLRLTKLHLPAELLNCSGRRLRSSRLTAAAIAVSTSTADMAPAACEPAPRRRTREKLPLVTNRAIGVVDIVKLAQKMRKKASPHQLPQKLKRGPSPLDAKQDSQDDAQPPAPKLARLSKEASAQTMPLRDGPSAAGDGRNRRRPSRTTPPLTRSRLKKRPLEVKLHEALAYRYRVK